MMIECAGGRLVGFRLSTFIIFASALAVWPAQARMLDCPLRDAPYSVESPLVDVLLKPEAKAVLQSELGGFIDTMRPMLSKTEAPTYAAIITPRILAGYAKASDDAIAAMDRRLAALAVTDADRHARCARYDDVRPKFRLPAGKPHLLVFEKITGFHHGETVSAAHAALQKLSDRNGWAIAFSDKGGVMAPDLLRQFDVVIWNNVSGDVLTLKQRAAFRAYMEKGGGFVGLHASGGDPVAFWDWYLDAVVGARFLGHPMRPQLQDGRIIVAPGKDPITTGLGADWVMHDEWYSFMQNPRESGAHVLATLDESSYLPGSILTMGADHPIAWTRCVGAGRAFYSAIGHTSESYTDEWNLRLLTQAIAWAAEKAPSQCRSSRAIKPVP